MLSTMTLSKSTSGSLDSSKIIQTESNLDLNIEEERKKMLKLVKTLLSKENSSENSENFNPKRVQTSTQNLDIQISVLELYQEENLPQSYTYCAKIKCVVCPNYISTTKCGRVGERSARWVLSNYRRHLYSHSIKTIAGKNDLKRKNKSILEAMQISAKSTKIDHPIGLEENSDILEKVQNSEISILLDRDSPTRTPSSDPSVRVLASKSTNELDLNSQRDSQSRGFTFISGIV